MAPATFTGGIRSQPWGWGGTWPFGHLRFDQSEIRIWGLGITVVARREAVLGIRVTGGLFAKVQIVMRDGSIERRYFVPFDTAAIRTALHARGWPVLDR